MSTIIWFTGLSGAGKTTLAIALKEKLESAHHTVTVVDGDVVRGAHDKKLGFSREDIRENNARIAEYIAKISDKFDFILLPVIAPFAADRAATRARLGKSYKEVYVACPVEVCAERDVKGLYAKAQRGEVANLIGVDPSTPYEIPAHPDFIIDTAKQAQVESVAKLFEWVHSFATYDLPDQFSTDMQYAVEAVLRGGKEIIKIYQQAQFGVNHKNDSSPVTEADQASDKIIRNILSQTGYPLLSEEGARSDLELTDGKAWIVDPLDGTKDFIARTGEFTILIGLILNGQPIGGVVYQPTIGALFIAEKDKGAYQKTTTGWRQLNIQDDKGLAQARMVMSRHHLTEEEKNILTKHNLPYTQKGSSGLKIVEIAAGRYDMYFTLAELKQWDLAAPHCILNEAGGKLSALGGKEIVYGGLEQGVGAGVVAGNARACADFLEFYQKR